MDYVVYGTGYGATLMLLGYAVRTWGPGLRYRPAEEGAYDRREFRSARSSWMRFTTGLGAAIATAGAVLVLVTFLLMLLNPGDDTGSTVVMIITALLLVGVAVWSWLFFERFGSWGVVSTPNVLLSHEPLHYDTATEKAQPSAEATAERDEADEDEPFRDEDEYLDEEAGLEPEDDDLTARYSKFELHHPEGEPEADARGMDVEDDERYEAQYGKYISHHPDAEQEASVVGEGEATDEEDDIEEIEEFVETLTPEEVTDDIVDTADEEPLDHDGDEIEAASFEDAVGHEPVENAGQDDPLEVIPQPEAELQPLLEPDPAEREQPAGRDEALRRLRERQAERAQRKDDDA